MTEGRAIADVILVEDDPTLRSTLASALRSVSLTVIEADTCAIATRAVREGRIEVVVTDLNLPDGDALQLLPTLRQIDGDLSIFVITGFGSIDLAVRAVKSGAEDFLTKPVNVDSLVDVVRRAVHRRRRMRSGMRPKANALSFVPVSSAMKRVEDQVERLRNADCSVLLLGETGTGKSVLARRIHTIGIRAGGPFIDVNCAGLSREFVESELFGHERGAFTGAHGAKAGLFDSANQGTLFLDEIGDVDPQVQPKVLKVIEEKRFRRMGDVKERTADVRLIAATHHDLIGAIERKTFRADLYYRISTVTITMPSLRDRVEDIIPLARYMLGDLALEPVDITAEAREVLLAHAWPGNIRELKNVLERAVLLREENAIRASDLRFDTRPSEGMLIVPSKSAILAAEAASPDSMKDLEREHIVRTLTAEGGRVEAAAKRLGMPRSTLYQKLKTYGIPTSRLMRKVVLEGNAAEPSDLEKTKR